MNEQPPNEATDRIERFVVGVRRRLALRGLWSAAAAVAIFVAGGLLVMAGARVLAGHAAEPAWYAVGAVVLAVGTLVGWVATLPRRDASARWADREWALQDALISWWHFRGAGKRDGFYQLQAEQTAAAVTPLDPAKIDVRPRRDRWVPALLLGAVACGLGFMEPSDSVKEQIEREAFLLAATAEANEALADKLEELTEGIDEQERELIDPNEIRAIIDGFEPTGDEKEALRQYARLETRLQKRIAKLSQRRDEELAAKAAAELKKAPETKRLAEPLAQKRFDRAAEELARLTPDRSAKLTERQKQAARLRAASQRMAAAARSRRAPGSPQGGAGQSGGASGESGAGAASQGGESSAGGGSAGGGSGSSDGRLRDAMLDLDTAVADLEDALREASEQERRLGSFDSASKKRCSSCQSRAESSLSRLSKCLSKMAIKRKAQSRLASLCKACSQCQGGLCKTSGLCQSNRAGQGGGIGSSTNESRREGLADPLAPGPSEQLSGIKSGGPSDKTVESADDGTAVSGRTAVARDREFRRSVESFVSREDVPARVRRGVKRYFESIHDTEPAPLGAASE